MSRIRHSALPKLDQCPCYESNPVAGPAAQRGLALDAALRLLLQGDARGMEPLSDADRESVRWAAETIMDFAGDDAVEVREEELKMRTPGIEHAGTADVVCSSKLWVGDLKTGQIRDYYGQMAAYAWALMEQYFVNEWTAHLIFCDQKQVVTHKFTYVEAKDTVERIVNYARDPYREPRACEYCGWCKLQDRCPAVVGPVTNTLELVEQEKGLSAIRERLLSDPTRLGQFLADAALFTSELITPLRDEAKKMLAANPEAIPGWQVSAVKGREHFDHIAIVQTAVASKCGMDSLVLAMGGKMTGKDYRAWCASMNQPVDESLARVGEGTTQLRQAKASAKPKTLKEK
jgi:hypothetical protein